MHDDYVCLHFTDHVVPSSFAFPSFVLSCLAPILLPSFLPIFFILSPCLAPFLFFYFLLFFRLYLFLLLCLALFSSFNLLSMFIPHLIVLFVLRLPFITLLPILVFSQVLHSITGFFLPSFIVFFHTHTSQSPLAILFVASFSPLNYLHRLFNNNKKHTKNTHHPHTQITLPLLFPLTLSAFFHFFLLSHITTNHSLAITKNYETGASDLTGYRPSVRADICLLCKGI